VVEWRVRRPVQAFDPLRIFQFPFYLENILVILLFCIMFITACIWASLPVGMGIRSVPFWFLCITVFFNYMFVVVDWTSRGFQHMPKLSGDLVFPSHDSRLFTIALLTLCYLAFLLGNWAEEFRAVRLLAAFFTYPLFFGLLIVHSRLTELLNPIKLLKTLYLFSTAGVSLIFYVLQLVTGALLYFEFQAFGQISLAHLLWQVPLTLILLFMLFRSLGVVLNTQGPSFGLPVLQNEDTQSAAFEEEARVELDKFVMSLHRWARVNEFGEAWKLIQAFQKENRHHLDDALFTRLSEWTNQRLAAMLGADIAERLMREGDTKRALSIFRQSYDMSPGFRFSSGSMALQFLERASDLASRQRLFGYLRYFCEYYPTHPAKTQVMLQLAELGLKEFDAPEAAQQALETALGTDPGIETSNEYRRLAAAIEARLRDG
jgi:tetratricopeptide (TPR) repeat protein